MALLGVPFKISYWAKNAKTGLSSISAKVLRPDGVIIGPLLLTEVADTFFQGNYTATYSPSTTDPEGNYIISLSSPNEDNHKAFKTEYFSKRTTIDVESFDIGINRRQVIEAETQSKLKSTGLVEGKNIAVSFQEKNESEAYFYKDDLEKFLDNTQYIGEF